jgi:hypothetical protein
MKTLPQHPWPDFTGLVPATRGDEAPLPWTPLPSSLLFPVSCHASSVPTLTQNETERFQLISVPKQEVRKHQTPNTKHQTLNTKH